MWLLRHPRRGLRRHLREIALAVGLLTADIVHMNETAGTMIDLVDALAIHETNLTNRDMIEGTEIMAGEMTDAAHLPTTTVMLADVTGEVPLPRPHLPPSSICLFCEDIF